MLIIGDMIRLGGSKEHPVDFRKKQSGKEIAAAVAEMLQERVKGIIDVVKGLPAAPECLETGSR